MKLILFSTHRQIREWLKGFENISLDKHKTIGEFLNEIIVVKGKKFIDNDIRKLYLFEVIKNLDIDKLGFRKEFLSFSKDSEFIFSFLKEIFIEKVDIDEVIMSDTYIEYEEHLTLIKQIRDDYKKLLDKDGYVDTFLIDEFFEINNKLLENIDEIEINLDGYLSKFDLEILNRIDKKIVINVLITKFNRPLIRKILFDLEEGRYKIDFHSKEILESEKVKSQREIEVSYFSKKFDEINFVFAKIAGFIESGLSPEKIAVILPDESFSEFLEEFDEYNNLNFAMGKSFRESNLYIKLDAIHSYLLNEDEISFLKAGEWIEEFQNSEVLDFIREKALNNELKIIDEELFKISQFKNQFKDKSKFLYFILERFKELSFDDKYSGKITVMGVLESRGVKYDGVIITNFNEGIVPNINSKDLFLNTAIRKKAGLPTRTDKENLQKHYYYSLIQHSKKVAISYIHNEKENVSRFLYQLDLETGQNRDEKYKEVLYSYDTPKNLPIYDEEIKIETSLTPTSLKMLLECPKKYYFSKVLGIENRRDNNINFGTVFHEAMEKVVKEKNRIGSSKDYYNILMSEIYQQLNSKKEIYEIRTKYEDSIKKFCEIDFDDMKFSETLSEKELKNFSFEGIELYCIVDRIDITKNSITLIDYKTGKLENVLKHPYEFQLTFYYLWAKKHYPNLKIITAYWDIQKAKFVEEEPKLEQLSEVLKNLPNRVEDAKDIVVDEKVVKKWQSICQWCDYSISCGRDSGDNKKFY
jgi:RecB family exonuclease